MDPPGSSSSTLVKHLDNKNLPGLKLLRRRSSNNLARGSWKNNSKINAHTVAVMEKMAEICKLNNYDWIYGRFSKLQFIIYT